MEYLEVWNRFLLSSKLGYGGMKQIWRIESCLIESTTWVRGATLKFMLEKVLIPCSWFKCSKDYTQKGTTNKRKFWDCDVLVSLLINFNPLSKPFFCIWVNWIMKMLMRIFLIFFTLLPNCPTLQDFHFFNMGHL